MKKLFTFLVMCFLFCAPLHATDIATKEAKAVLWGLGFFASSIIASTGWDYSSRHHDSGSGYISFTASYFTIQALVCGYKMLGIKLCFCNTEN